VRGKPQAKRLWVMRVERAGIIALPSTPSMLQTQSPGWMAERRRAGEPSLLLPRRLKRSFPALTQEKSE
jgi:hypothetical protein